MSTKIEKIKKRKKDKIKPKQLAKYLKKHPKCKIIIDKKLYNIE